MKKMMLLMFVLLMAFGSALSEANPDGTVYTVYRTVYDPDALGGFERMMYLEPSGLLLSAYSDEMEITVTIEESSEPTDAAGFMDDYVSGVSRYGRVISREDAAAWTMPGQNEGIKTRFAYMYNKAGETDDVYVTDVYCAPLRNNMFLVIVFNSWSGNAGELLDQTENVFFESFSLEREEVSTQFLAMVKDAYTEDGADYVVVDFCQVEYDADIFTVYVANDTPVEHVFKLSEDALLWMPRLTTGLYSINETEATAENIRACAEAYYEINRFDIICQILFDENNEILWMMHYNAF